MRLEPTIFDNDDSKHKSEVLPFRVNCSHKKEITDDRDSPKPGLGFRVLNIQYKNTKSQLLRDPIRFT